MAKGVEGPGDPTGLWQLRRHQPLPRERQPRERSSAAGSALLRSTYWCLIKSSSVDVNIPAPLNCWGPRRAARRPERGSSNQRKTPRSQSTEGGRDSARCAPVPSTGSAA